MEQEKGRALKVFLAIACGVGLGIVLGRELSEWWSPAAWLGPIVAGVFAWLAVDFKAALAAIPTAWRAVKPPRGIFVFIGWYILVYSLVGFWCLLPFAVCSVAITLDGGLVTIVSFGAAILGGVIAGSCGSAEWEKWTETNQRLKRAAWIMFPPVTIFYYLPRALWWFITNVLPRFVRFCGRFFAAWWRLTHSDLRVLCLVYAAFFTAVGLLAGGPAWLWMIGGGALGVFDDKALSVWVWKLKLAPAKIQKPQRRD